MAVTRARARQAGHIQLCISNITRCRHSIHAQGLRYLAQAITLRIELYQPRQPEENTLLRMFNQGVEGEGSAPSRELDAAVTHVLAAQTLYADHAIPRSVGLELVAAHACIVRAAQMLQASLKDVETIDQYIDFLHSMEEWFVVPGNDGN